MDLLSRAVRNTVTGTTTSVSTTANEALEGRRVISVKTLDEASDAVANTMRAVNVVVLPPIGGDSGSEDSDTELPAVDNIEDVFEPAGELEIEEYIDDDLSVAATYKITRDTPRWKKSHVFYKPIASDNNWTSERVMELAEKTPFQIWKEIFSDSLIEHVRDQTNLHAQRDHNCATFNCTKKEVEQFLGILLLSGYHTLPETKHYWSTQCDFGVTLVYNTMPKNRFVELKRHIHFADNQKLTKGSKMSKVALLYDALNSVLVKFGFFHELLSIDESMVPYYGRHSCKMFIKGKPIRYGYKIWMLCSSDGYPYHMDIYQGKEQQKHSIPLSTRMVTNMVKVVTTHSLPQRHQLFFDNFFTSYDLLIQLSALGIRAIGTIQQNRSAGAAVSMITDK